MGGIFTAEFIQYIEPLINSLGFPIVCVLGLGWFSNKTIKDNREDTNKIIENYRLDSKTREEQYQKQIATFSDTLNKFNETLTRIDSRLEVVEGLVKK